MISQLNPITNFIMTVEENESLFQKHIQLFRAGNPKSSEIVWECVRFCCANIIKSQGVKKGAIFPDLDDKIMESTCRVMKKIIEGNTDPRKLSSFCYLYVIGVIYDRKLQKEEKTISWELWQSYKLKEENEIH